MNPHVFREYDIRGVADTDLDDAFTLDLGRALGTFHQRGGRKRVALSRDCRQSSPRLCRALERGLREAGVDVVDLGVVPTPLMYFAVKFLELDGGVQITGSHNPPPENGFKMMKGQRSLYGQDIRALKLLMEAQDFDLPGDGERESFDPLPAYRGYMRGNIRLARKVRFAVDAGNGAAGPSALAVFHDLGLEPTALLCEMDGLFPVHHPDPTDPETLQLLRDTVAEQGLELGIAFDGDGDRMGVVDAKGNILWGDRLLALFARDVLSRHPGAKIIGEVKCSETLYEDISAHGGEPIMWKTGHSLIKAKMQQENALLAGEMSGHLFFADRYYGFDDATYAALRLLEIVSDSDRPLDELLSDLPELFTTPELRVPCPDEEKFALVERVTASFQEDHDVITVDGARVRFAQGWGLVRASNTQPVLVLRFEADTQARLDEYRTEVEARIEACR